MGMVYESRCWFYIELSIPIHAFSGLVLFAKESYVAYTAADENGQVNKDVLKRSAKQMPALTV